MSSSICQVLSLLYRLHLDSGEAGMTVFELRSSKSDPAKKSPTTIVDLIDALDHQVLFAKGIADAIRGGTEAFVGDPCCMDGATALIAEHIEKLSGIAAHYKRRKFQ